jgi:hypothetical protein
MISRFRYLLGQIQSSPIHYDLEKYKQQLWSINSLGPNLKSRSDDKKNSRKGIEGTGKKWAIIK